MSKHYKIIFMSGLDIWSMKEGVGAPSFHNTLKLYLDKGDEVVLIKPDGKWHVPAIIDGLKIYPFNNDFFDLLRFIPKVSFFGRIISQQHLTRKYLELGDKEIKISKFPCILYAYEVNGVKAAKILAEKYQIPLITRFQGTILCEIKNTIFNRMRYFPHFEALSQKSDLVIMTDDGTFGTRVLKELGNDSEQIMFWKNGVEFEVPFTIDLKSERNRVRESWGITQNQFVFMTLCRLANWKRIDRSIKSMPSLVAIHPECHLVVVGEGDMEQELKEMTRNLGVSANVHFVGSVPQKETWRCFLANDVFLSLNDLGNVGNPLLEALFWNKPIITLDNGDTPSVITDGYNGIMLPAGKDELIAQTMISIYEDNQLRQRLSENSKQYAKEYLWTWRQRMDKEYEVVIDIAKKYYRKRKVL